MRRELSAYNEISASRFALDSLCLPLVGCCSLRRLDCPPGPCPALSGLSLRDRSIHFHVLPRLFCIRPRNSNPSASAVADREVGSRRFMVRIHGAWIYYAALGVQLRAAASLLEPL